MTTTATATTTAATNRAGTAAAAANAVVEKKKSASFGGDFDSFLTLLTTQLKNQDPTKAMDVSEMTNQLVQFASVEQQIKMNDSLGQMVALQQTGQLTAAAPLLGQTIEVAGDQLSLQGGSATLRLPAAGRATTATVEIQDAAGRAIRQLELPLDTTSRDWKWDGRDQRGNKLVDGAYRFVVSGRDLNGAAQPVTGTVLARATGLERDGTNLKLMLGSLGVGFDQVRSVGAD
jgi:flagellar basal-body rod modification protein FlgD